MKIAVASDDGDRISPHLGRAKGFVIFEIENGKILDRKYIPNTFDEHSHEPHHDHNTHHHHDHSALIKFFKDCKVVISHGVGRRLYNDLTSIGIEVYVTDETHVDRAIELYLKGELKSVSKLIH